MQRIAVISQKGGAGKTTVATNLAAAAHLDGRRTLIIDHDPQGSAVDWYHSRQDNSPLHGINLVPLQSLTFRQLAELERGYEFVAIDTPPRLTDVTRSAVALVDQVIIVIEPAFFSLWSLDFTLSLVDSADAIRDQLDRPPVQRYILLNKTDARTRVAKLAREGLADRAELCDIELNLRTAFVLASGCGETVVSAEPDGAAAAEVNALYALLKTRAQSNARLVA